MVQAVGPSTTDDFDSDLISNILTDKTYQYITLLMVQAIGPSTTDDFDTSRLN